MRFESDKLKLSQLVGKFFIQYSRMKDIVNYAYSGSDATEINVFIDLYSIKVEVLGKDFISSSPFELCALILDLCVFYKKYFLGIGVKTTFYLIDSNNLPAYTKKEIPTYNLQYATSLTSDNAEWVRVNMEYLSILCPYIPNMYCIPTTFEASIVMQELASASQAPSMVIGRDDYLSMLPGLVKNLSWVRPSKYHGDDISTVYTESNVYEFVQKLMMIDGSINIPCSLGPTRLDVVYALTKFPARNLGSCMHYKTLVKICDSDPLMPTAPPDVIYKASKSTKHLAEIPSRYKALSIPYQASMYRMSAESALISKYRVDLCDTEGLKHINNQYFNNLLDLDELLR